jgi:beta-lysine N6-acetyltransferase
MNDITIEIGKSKIQHGPDSDRIYLMHLDADDLPTIIEDLEDMAEKHGYSKIFAKVPEDAAGKFEASGFTREAEVPGFYGQGAHKGVFMGRFLKDERAEEAQPDVVDKYIQLARDKADSPAKQPSDDEFDFLELGPDDAEEMAEVYKEVFPIYPFPIHDPAYLRETMETHIRYFGARRKHDGGKLVAIASAEMDRGHGYVEMTDFATLPDQRGKGLATFLLVRMEEAMRDEPITTLFTIARALSAGMNITFARQNYQYAGTLTNNTGISGGIESMNVWYKPAG